jgi:hypothetical protein
MLIQPGSLGFCQIFLWLGCGQLCCIGLVRFSAKVWFFFENHMGEGHREFAALFFESGIKVQLGYYRTLLVRAD